ncbi:MAG: hypothetical protein U0169_21750 [Polyangiaceae bacterium]
MDSPHDTPPDDEAPALTRGKKVRLVIAGIGVLLATASWVYVRYLVPKSALGGPCKWAMNCAAEAPVCMRASEEGDGACSRPCDVGADCAPGIRCVEIELEERDERGMPKKGGHCFPQSFLDARKAKKSSAPK